MSDTTTSVRQDVADGSMPPRRLFTAGEYHQMSDAGILRPDERTELVNGEILLMAAIGSRHFGCVNTLNDRFAVGLRGRAIVSVQNPVRLASRSEPQPDLVLLRPRQDRYFSALPGPEDVFLLVEVSDTTLRFDTGVKLPLYAEAGIPELWIVDVDAGSVRVCRDPSGAAYQRTETVRRGDTLAPAAFPDLALNVADFLPDV